MRLLLLLICTLFALLPALAQPDTSQKTVPGRQNSPDQQEKPYIILISADGFRHDYAEKHQAKHLLALREEGVQAAAMRPSFPSKTFSNHYTLVTGLYPAHHGLINNRFYDRQRQEFYSPGNRKAVEDSSWYGGIPIWVLAEQQQMLSASFFWVGSEAPIRGIHPTYYYHYNEAIPMEERISTVVDWLNLPAAQRPHLITFYLPEVDHAGHRYGPDAPETASAVQFVDKAVQQLTAAVAATGLPVSFIFLSDHGMTEVDTKRPLSLPAAIDTAEFIIADGDVIIELYAKKRRHIKKTYRRLKKEAEGYTVYRPKDMPAYLHYGRENDRMQRIGDIILLAEWPRIFHSASKAPVPGHHGYDPVAVKDMHTTFYAWGPAFKSGLHIPAFENVHVYPLLASILGLSYTHDIDGDPAQLRDILQEPAE